MADKTATRRVNVIIDTKAAEGSFRALTKEQKALNNAIADMKPGTEEYIKTAKRLRELDGLMKEHRNNIRSIGEANSKIGVGLKNFIGLAGVAFTAQAVVDYGKELFKLGTEMEVLTKKARTVFGEALPLVTEQAEKNAAAMGLSVSQYINASAAIADLLIPMGFQREEAANISTNLTNLSGALSEWTGGQKSAKEVTDILGKAILGEREELKSLGIAIAEEDVKNRLKEKGLEKLTGTMLQQAKAAVTLELITEKSIDAQTAYIGNSDTLVRKQAELSAKFTTIKEQLATALIPVFHRLFEIAEPVVTTFFDLVTALFNGEKATSSMSGGMKIAATIWGNAGKVVKFLWDVFVALGGFLLNNFGGVIEFVGGLMLGFYNTIVNSVNAVGKFLDIKVDLKPINIDDFKKSIDDARNYLNESKIKEPIEPKIETKTSGGIAPTGDSPSPTSAGGSKKAKEDKEAQDLERRLKRLQEIRDKYAEDERLKTLSDDDRKIEELRAKYTEQIEEAKALEAKGVKEATDQRIALERARDIALTDLQNELFDKKLEETAKRESEITAKELEELNARDQAKKEAKALIDEAANEVLLSEKDQALLDLETQYQGLLRLAEEHGINTEALNKAHREEVAKINTDYDKKDKEKRINAQKAQAEALAKSFQAASNVIGSMLEGLSALGLKNTALSKLLAVAQIGINTAKALSEAVASGAGLPFPANIPAIASGVAAVLTNIAAAKKTLDSVSVPQKKTGGYHTVKGMDDGISYNAQYIGSPQSGILPSHPVVLASEAGSEYFVSNKDLQNPVIANYTRIIDNISKGRGIRQFIEGGFTDGVPKTSTSTSENPYLIAVLREISEKLDYVYARVDDDTIQQFNRRQEEIKRAAGVRN